MKAQTLKMPELEEVAQKLLQSILILRYRQVKAEAIKRQRKTKCGWDGRAQTDRNL